MLFHVTMRKFKIMHFHCTNVDVLVLVLCYSYRIISPGGAGYVVSALSLQLPVNLSLFLNKKLKHITRVSHITFQLNSAGPHASISLSVIWATAGSKLFIIMCMMAAAAFVLQGYCSMGRPYKGVQPPGMMMGGFLPAKSQAHLPQPPATA